MVRWCVKAAIIATAGLVPLAVCTRADGAVGTILLVVVNSASLTAQETAKKTLMEGWGYTVTPISASALQSTFDTSCRSASCAYISCTVSSATLGTKLATTTIPVIVELDAQATTLGFSSTQTNMNATTIDISNTTHYITSAFSSGSLSLFSSNQPMRYLSGTLGGFTTLGKRASNTNPALAVYERGDTIYPSGTASSREVYLPWSGSSVDITALTSNGQTLMQRSIEWCLLPVSRWKLDDGSGSTAVDMYAGHNGTVSGASWTTGKISGALSFNGSTNYVSIANDVDYQVTKAFTVAAWVRGTSWNASADYSSIILRKGHANPNNWQVGVKQGYAAVTLDAYDNGSYKGSTYLTTGVWHHVAGTWDGSKVRIYVDGALDNVPPTYTTALGTDTRALYMGGRIGSTDVINGRLDDVRFYNRALTAAEIAALAAVSPTITSWENVAP